MQMDTTARSKTLNRFRNTSGSLSDRRLVMSLLMEEDVGGIFLLQTLGTLSLVVHQATTLWTNRDHSEIQRKK